MSESLKDFLVVSDMDGTLLTSDKRIASSDLETIRLFRMLGGHFTVASGRTISSVELYPQLCRVIDPGIACGGCVIYDFQKKEAAESHLLPHLAARQGLRDMTASFPGLGAMVMGGDLRLYKMAPSAELDILINDEHMTYFLRPPEDLPEEWNKVLFAGSPQLLGKVEEYVSGRTYPGVYFVRTNEIYLEMMPKGVSKGSALHDLCATVGIPLKNTICIGDYFNDIDIMRQAGYAVAMRNAPDEVKEVADEVIGGNDDSGVGQFLYGLIKKYAP